VDAVVCTGVATEEEEELRRWQGWTVVATLEGRLFFHNDARQLSQWHQPPELYDILGEWVEIVDESQPSRPSFWRNELLRISLWKDPRQTTNIFQAALDGNLFFMQLYAEVDGQLDVVDPRGRSALHYSCAGGATQSALFLLQRQVEVDSRDENAATPLIFACRYGYASVVKVLLDAQADLNATCEGGNTAVHEAASMGQLDCLHLLLLCGADVARLNDEGEAAHDIAAKKRHLACLTLLRRHARPPDVQRGPLHPDGPPLGHARNPACSTGMEASGAAAYPGQLPRAAAAGEEALPPAMSGHPPRQRDSGCRKPGRAPSSQYGRVESDSESEDAAPEACLGHDGTDSGGASSGSSEADRGRSGRQPRGRGRRRDRSPVALGLLSWAAQLVDSARRRAFPAQADLGLPNMYRFNEETKRWELHDRKASTTVDA